MKDVMHPSHLDDLTALFEAEMYRGMIRVELRAKGVWWVTPPGGIDPHSLARKILDRGDSAPPEMIATWTSTGGLDARGFAREILARVDADPWVLFQIEAVFKQTETTWDGAGERSLATFLAGDRGLHRVELCTAPCGRVIAAWTIGGDIPRVAREILERAAAEPEVSWQTEIDGMCPLIVRRMWPCLRKFSERGLRVRCLEEFLSSTTPPPIAGHLRASYAQLVELLGPPNCEDTSYKVFNEWKLETEDGPIYLYDYLETLYSGLSIDEFRAEPSYAWHVGARDKKAAENFIAAMGRGLSKLRTSPDGDHDDPIAATTEGEAPVDR